MTSIAEAIAKLPGPLFVPARYPYEYALDLALDHDIVPAEYVEEAHQQARSELRSGIKRGPDRRAVLRRAVVRWCRANGEQLEDVYVLMANRYLELHSIDRPIPTLPAV